MQKDLQNVHFCKFKQRSRQTIATKRSSRFESPQKLNQIMAENGGFELSGDHCDFWHANVGQTLQQICIKMTSVRGISLPDDKSGLTQSKPLIFHQRIQERGPSPTLPPRCFQNQAVFRQFLGINPYFEQIFSSGPLVSKLHWASWPKCSVQLIGNRKTEFQFVPERAKHWAQTPSSANPPPADFTQKDVAP